MSLILDIQSLSISFKQQSSFQKVVENVSFTLERGKTIGIVGESGSGKSITSLAVMQLLPPNGYINQGSILFYSDVSQPIELTKLSEEEKQKIRGNRIAMIFQEPMTSLNPVYKCGKQVAEAIMIHSGIDKKEAKIKTLQLFREVKLPDPEKAYRSYPHELSGGQKQRIMIAMAISCNPDLLIADEPTTALDVTVQKSIIELLKNLQTKYGMGIIFITHDLGVIADIAHDIAVMYKGKIVEQGETHQILINPQHPYTRSLIACKPSLSTSKITLPVVSDFLEIRADGTILEKQFVPNSNSSYLFPKEEYQKEPILVVQELSVGFPIHFNLLGQTTAEFKALDKITFDVYQGETLGLVGESGCGKTTLGRTLVKLINQKSGSISYKGNLLSKMNKSAIKDFRKKVQFIFQDPYSSLNPRHTVGDALMEPLIVHQIGKNARERRDKIVQLLEKVGLSENHFYRYPHEFSGGQRQRIVIARALTLNPEFIICDESVSALDVSVQAQVLNLLNELKREFHFTYIFISHDLSVVKFMADRLIVMNKGKIEEIGFADDIYNNPQTEYSKKLINAIPSMPI